MDQVREERTRLSVALDFSKDERNHLAKQLKEMEEKTGTVVIDIIVVEFLKHDRFILCI